VSGWAPGFLFRPLTWFPPNLWPYRLSFLAGSGPFLAGKIHFLAFDLCMKPALLFLLIGFLWGHAQAQSALPVIRAGSTVVDVRDDGHLDRAAWNLSPETRPDVYRASRSRKPKPSTPISTLSGSG
jgi:hypothetical protein